MAATLKNKRRSKNSLFGSKSFPTTTTSSENGLNFDVLVQILECLVLNSEEHDKTLSMPHFSPIYPRGAYSNLRNCLLVCKWWCTAAVGILWKQPFNMYRSSPDHGIKVIETYLRFVEKKDIHKDLRDSIPKGVPTLDYPSFLRHLDFGTMLSFVWDWCQVSPTDKNKNSVQIPENVTNLLFKLFLKKNVKLSWIRVFPSRVPHSDIYMHFGKLSKMLSSVTAMEIHGNAPGGHDLWNNFAKSCSEVEHIDICTMVGAEYKRQSLQSLRIPFPLIKNQKKLRTLRLHHCTGNMSFLLSPLAPPSLSKVDMNSVLYFDDPRDFGRVSELSKVDMNSVSYSTPRDFGRVSEDKINDKET